MSAICLVFVHLRIFKRWVALGIARVHRAVQSRRLMRPLFCRAQADKCSIVDPPQAPIVTYSSEALPMSPVRLRPGDRVHRARASCDRSASASGRVHHTNASRVCFARTNGRIRGASASRDRSASAVGQVHRASASRDRSASASGRVHCASASCDRRASGLDEYFAPAPAVIAAPAPVEEMFAPAPAVFAAPALVNEYMAPAPAVIAAPAPTIRTELLRSLAVLAPHLSQITSSARRQPLQPPARNGKGRGVFSPQRHGVEQQSFAYTVSPRRALPLPLSDVV